MITTVVRLDVNYMNVIYYVQPIIITNDKILARKTVRNDIKKYGFKFTGSGAGWISTLHGSVKHYYLFSYRPRPLLAIAVSGHFDFELITKITDRSGLIDYIKKNCLRAADKPFDPSVLSKTPHSASDISFFLMQQELYSFVSIDGKRHIFIIDMPITWSPVMKLLEWRKSVELTARRLGVQRKDVMKF